MSSLYPFLRRIPCEEPRNKMWDLYLLLESEPQVISFLCQRYTALGEKEAKKLAYRAAEPLIHYIKQARQTYLACYQADVAVKPLLSYYGMTYLCKAFLLQHDPYYPRKADVLRHGLTTRKRKKRNFRFYEDEVKIQREGLFPLLTQALHAPSLEAEFIHMRSCYALLPELQDSYRQVFGESTLAPILELSPSTQVGTGMSFCVEESILDNLHLTKKAFLQRLNHHRISNDYRFTLDQPAVRGGRLHLLWQHNDIPHVNRWAHGFHHPFFREDTQGGYSLYTGDSRLVHVSEILIHLILLFALSMVCRYETPLWGEIIGGSAAEDRIFIHEFLRLTERKFPQLMLHAFFQEKVLFTTS
ncbi:YaaC family protein [Mechercharimyces sp. CAU 1602]|uniref:YaaC family protein n=1 Tax=Mechercharimyces sp. CAU 1602 TaxID=2973933 RepID=UPI0021622D86|nr:YaaC family protein [Mechercharimyces sp. CAU 1602]MCS1352705.1 YaaC family protein [Mechercharimyces sp. CAU 1602]